jgi:hypothetical protein
MSPDPKMMTARHLANPQKWNKYVYVINNPLTRFDPDGMDDYVVFRTVTTGMHAKEWAAAEKAITGSKDSQGRQNTFHMIEGEAATVPAFRNALATPDTHVVFVGHAAEEKGVTKGIGLAGGDSEGKNGSNWITSGPNGPGGAPGDLDIHGTVSDPVSASSVALFGCDTYALASQYDGTNFTGVQSGPDGTNLETVDSMGAAWLTAGGGQAGDAAANAVIQNSQHPEDTGDNVESEEQKQPNK